jgi:hypothetical protein
MTTREKHDPILLMAGLIAFLIIALVLILYISHGNPYPVPRNPLPPHASIPGIKSP